MKRPFFFLVVCLLAGNIVNAQQELDGKYGVDDFLPAGDTAAIKQLIRRGNALADTDTRQAEVFLSRSVRDSRRADFPNGVTSASLSLAHLYLLQQAYDRSLHTLQQLLTYLQQGDASGASFIPLAYAYMTTVYMKKGDYARAIYCAYQTLEEAGHVQQVNRKLQENILITYVNLATLWDYMKKPEKSLYYLQKAAAMAGKGTRPDLLPAILNNMASNAVSQKDFREAIRLFTLQLDIGRKINDLSIQGMALLGLGDAYIQMEMPSQGIPYLEQMIALSKKIRQGANRQYDYASLADSYNTLGKAYYQAGNDKQAAQMLLEAQAQAAREGDTRFCDYFTLYKVFTRMGRYKEASEQLYLHLQAYTAQLNEKNAELLTQAETKYSSAEKDKLLAQRQLALAGQKRVLQRKNLWIGSAAGVALLVSIVSAGIYLNNRHRQQISKLKAIVAGEEQERIRIARELHDGIMVQFSAVKMHLSALVNRHRLSPGVEDFKEPIRQLDAATRELRRTAHNLMPDILQEEGLTEAISFFCKNFRQHTALDIRCQLYGTIPRLAADFELSVYRIVQELVNNVIRHARATRAVVQLSCQDKLLMLTVEDNGTGFVAAEAVEDGSGVGLKNVRNRVDSLQGHLDIRSTAQSGTTVYIEFDISHFISKNTTET